MSHIKGSNLVKLNPFDEAASKPLFGMLFTVSPNWKWDTPCFGHAATSNFDEGELEESDESDCQRGVRCGRIL